ncbi:MAG: hypothetical protein IKP91_07290 [Bacteroidaceae bacterium]|nr:hypothetical protein [Bacteroidaceae bacterium]
MLPFGDFYVAIARFIDKLESKYKAVRIANIALRAFLLVAMIVTVVQCVKKC